MSEALSFLQSVAGYAQAQQTGSANRPVRLATIDPTYDVFADYPSPPAEYPKVTFEGETTLSGKRYPFVDGYLPMPGDRVWMAPVGNTYLICGKVGHDSLQGFIGDGGLLVGGDAQITGTLTVFGMESLSAGSTTNISSFTNTSASNGSPVVGFVFTAPPSGRVWVTVNAAIQAVSGQVFCGPMVRQGNTVGSGTIVSDPSSEPQARIATSTGIITASATQQVSGLVPGNEYNACVVHFTTGTGTLYHRYLAASPVF